MSLNTGTLNRRVRIERPVTAAGFMGAGAATWELVAEVWAGVRDVLPGQGESQDEGIEISRRPARVWMRWRPDLDPSMRLVIDGRPREIIAGPARLGDDGLALTVVEQSIAGGAG